MDPKIQLYLSSNLNSRIVLLSALPETITYQELETICSKFGKIHELKYPLVESGKAFCIFCDWRSAKKMVDEKKDAPLDQATIKIIKQQGINSKIYVSASKPTEFSMDEIKEVMSQYGEIENTHEISKNQWIINYYSISDAIQCEKVHTITYKSRKLNFKFFKTIKDLYDELKKTQTQLCCERAMRSVELYSKDQYIKDAIHNQVCLLVEEKNYYLQFFNIFNHTKDFNEIPFADSKKIYVGNTKPMILEKFFHLDELFDKLLENKGIKLRDPDVFNLLAFSLLPALMNYFTIDSIDENTNDKHIESRENFKKNYYLTILKKLLSKSNENTNDKDHQKLIFKCIIALLIPMFASPNFFNFVKETFQPVFSELQDIIVGLNDKQIDKAIDNSIKKLIISIHNNVHLVPSYIAKSINEIDQQTFFIRECFLKLAFANPINSIIYGIFHFSKPPKEDLLKKIFNKVYEDSFCDQLLTCICKSHGFRTLYQTGQLKDQKLLKLYKEDSNFYFNNDMIQYQFKQIFQTCILSRADLNLYNYITTSNGKKPLKPNEKLHNEFHQVFLQYDTKEDDEFVESVFYNRKKDNDDAQQTRDNTKGFDAPYLRHLLQNLDPLPNIVDESFLNNLEPIQLFDFFEKRGEMGTLSSRKWYNANAKLFFKSKSYFEAIQYILEVLPQTLLEQLDEIETLSIVSHIKFRSKNILSNLLHIPLRAFQFLSKTISLEINPKMKEKLSFKRNSEYCHNPQLFHNEFNSNLRNAYDTRNNQNVSENASILFEMMKPIVDPKNKGPIDNSFYIEFKKFYDEMNIDEKGNDEQYNNNLNEKFDEIFQECLNIQVAEKFKNKEKNKDKKKVVVNNDDDDDDIDIDINKIEKKIEKFNEKEYFLEKIRILRNQDNELIQFGKNIFNETSIFRLIENICRLSVRAYFFFKDGWAGGEFGANETAFYTPLVILLCKPKNISFLCSYVTFFDNVKSECFDQEIIVAQSNLVQTKIVYDNAIKSIEERNKE